MPTYESLASDERKIDGISHESDLGNRAGC